MNNHSKAKFQPWIEDSFAANHRVQRMTSVPRWIYRTLLAQAFVCATRPRLPDDDEELWMLAGCDSLEQWNANKTAVLAMFKRTTIDGIKVLSHHRLEEDWAANLDIRESKSKAGKKSGEARSEHQLAKSNTCSNNRTNVPEVEQVSKEVSKEVREEKDGPRTTSLSDTDKGERCGQDKSPENGNRTKIGQQYFAWLFKEYEDFTLSAKHKSKITAFIEASSCGVKVLQQATARILDALDLADPYMHADDRLATMLGDRVAAVLCQKQEAAKQAALVASEKIRIERQAAEDRAKRAAEKVEEPEDMPVWE